MRTRPNGEAAGGEVGGGVRSLDTQVAGADIKWWHHTGMWGSRAKSWLNRSSRGDPLTQSWDGTEAPDLWAIWVTRKLASLAI